MGDACQFEEVTGGKVLSKDVLMQTAPGMREYVACLDIVGENQPEAIGVGHAKSASLKIDGVVIEKPKQFHGVFPSPIPPSSPKYHLRLPSDVAIALGAQAAWRKGYHGENVTIAMPDSGWYRHPFFTANGYKVKKPIVAIPDTDPSKDPVGHGTGESANIFAVAPGSELQPIRGTDTQGNFVGVIAGFLKAKSLAPQIITNSWGGDFDYPPTEAQTKPTWRSLQKLRTRLRMESWLFSLQVTGNLQSLKCRAYWRLAGYSLIRTVRSRRLTMPAATRAPGSTRKSFPRCAAWLECSPARNV